MIVIRDFARLSRDVYKCQLYYTTLHHHGWFVLSTQVDYSVDLFKPYYEALIDWQNGHFLTEPRADTKSSLKEVLDHGCVPYGKLAMGYTSRLEGIGTDRNGRERYGRKPMVDPDVMALVALAYEMKADGPSNNKISEVTNLYPPESRAWDLLFRNRM